ncbi:MAG: hypothetical protein WAW13_04210 [Minisyncoccia bacterium]
MEYDLLVKLIPPAIALSVLAYFVNFFGKVISDQQPFLDDRKWHAQLHGSVFVVNIILGGLIGIWLAEKSPLIINNTWLFVITFAVFSVISTALLFEVQYIGSHFFKYKRTILADLDKKYDGLFSFAVKVGKYLPQSIVPVVVFYFGAQVYSSGNFYMIAISMIMAFFIFLWSATKYSYKSVGDVALMNIYFKDTSIEPLISVQVLKINDDNIRIRNEDHIFLLNKNEVLKVEMKIAESSL